MIERDYPRTIDASVERKDRYTYVQSTEQVNPQTALLARQIHARSYQGEGFIRDEAIDETGQVTPDIDKARGDAVEYYLGFSEKGVAVSTLRKVSVTEDIGLESLPGYQLCRDNLSEEGKEVLLIAELEGRPIKEISSFGHIPEVTPLAGLELLRHALQESYGTGELWFFTMVTEKYNTLVNEFGPRVVRKIGEEVAINDDRVNNITLTPVIVDTTSFFDDIKEGVLSEPNERKRQRLLRSLRHFAEGLTNSRLSNEVQLLLDTSSFGLTAYAKQQGVRSGQLSWSQPLQLDLGNNVDALYSKRLIDEGKVESVVDPPWHEEFPDLLDRGVVDQDGSWFYYPWLKSMVHFPDQETYRGMRQTRDRPLVTKEEQESLHTLPVLYAGLSVGSHIHEHMVYAGVGGSHILADFDTVSVSNLNRIHVGMPQVGERKTDSSAKRASELDPYLEQRLLHEGINRDTLQDLPTTPSIIFDAVDDFAAKALLRMYAKENRLPLIMATDVGYKSIVDVERHDIEDVEPFNGRLNQSAIEAMLADRLTPEQRMKIMTRLIGLNNASFRLLQSASDKTFTGFPQLDVTASQGGALATIVARDILLGRDVKSGRHVHDARKSMDLPAEVPFRDGLKILKKFLAKR